MLSVLFVCLLGRKGIIFFRILWFGLDSHHSYGNVLIMKSNFSKVHSCVWLTYAGLLSDMNPATAAFIRQTLDAFKQRWTEGFVACFFGSKVIVKNTVFLSIILSEYNLPNNIISSAVAAWSTSATFVIVLCSCCTCAHE